MVYLRELEEKIEALRLKMYEAYSKNPSGQEVLQISQTLDEAINQLEQQKRQQ
ncbi:Spo0E family sporulation regulatory protein-aspartic acid phosphatase [Sediminibacillus dalangtanensis]|uniref:Spo0E family sporulation regulatory protein-aspartic acid phosphatase n=1 Tax=Sediminibacillus dalangtanensis TaxID=2729421 RepID=A0ABX7VUW1_9BACI|nr:aspartyl-phosphate phosphatase Spo0E family protein [Sediminibacillus dalangtanensis]QTN00324.1 Spo0E family sporulation regulatory protein-aspartic acid phosphatase [Sediminibacillus dalangtanensis]